jgi:hypothetical protein
MRVLNGLSDSYADRIVLDRKSVEADARDTLKMQPG